MIRRRIILRMAWREARGAWRQFAASFASVALGVAAVVAVGTFAANLDRALTREGRALLGGDLEVRSSRPLGPDVEAALEGLRREGAAVVRVRELPGMARGPRGAAALVALKAVEEGYPLYGAVETEPPGPVGALVAGGGAVVAADLLSRLGLRDRTDVVVDAACEDGLVPVWLARRTARVVGIAPDREAMHHAWEHARLNGVENCVFYTRAPARVVAKLRERGGRFDAAVLTSRRAPAPPELFAGLADAGAQRLALAGSSLPLLAADLRTAQGAGFHPRAVQPVDLLPQTSRIHSVVSLVRAQGR